MLAKMKKFSCWITETDPAALVAECERLLHESGFNIVGSCEKHFEPQGFTKLWLLAESHLAVHTFPERGKTYLELSSCVQAQYNAFLQRFNFKQTESD